MYLSSLHLADFRNYESLDLVLPPEGALFAGSNGSGKTNLLESIHTLCLGRSQRGAKRTDMIRAGAAVASIRGTFHSDNSPEAPTEASLGFSRDRKMILSCNGSRVRSLAEWFSHGAVVPFGPDDVLLVQGQPSERRRFIDILISQIDPAYLERLTTYHRVLANRNKTLATTQDHHLLDVLDIQLVESGDYLQAKRVEIMEFCSPIFVEMYAAICGGREHANFRFDPSISLHENGMKPWREVFYNTLKNNRKRDLELGYSSCGPHRDTILFFVNDRSSRTFASQGQCRSLALALRLCSVQCIETYRKEAMIFLVDDAFSELDDSRIAQVYPLICTRGQVLLTTPADNLPVAVDGQVFRVDQGTVRPQ